jgi:hypothetical protein
MADEPTDVIVAEDEWRTFKRVLPRDVHELLKSFEADVAHEIGTGLVGIGGSVQIWSIITRFLDEHREALKQMAKEWTGEDSSS